MARQTDKTKAPTQRKKSRFILFCANHGKWYSAMRSVLGVIINLVVFSLGTNLLSDYYNSRGVEFKALVWVVLIVVGMAIALTVWAINDRVSNTKTENERAEFEKQQVINSEREKQESLINCAVEHLVKVNTAEQERLLNESIAMNDNRITHRALAEICYKNIQNAIDACFDSIQDYHNSLENDPQKRLTDTFNLTVNFMTESYIYSYEKKNKILPAITIAAWRNFNSDKEPSGRSALADNPQFYASTEAAKMYYGEYKKEIKIISSTEKANITINKEDVYKLQSMVIAPVLSQGNRLIGTLVVHCNENNFFQEDNKAFFDTLLKIFTESIKKDKVMLDALMKDDSLVKELTEKNSIAVF